MNLKMMRRTNHAERGFTLAEMLVVLFMMSLLTILTLNVTGPWLAFKAQGETEQRLQRIRAAVEAYYESNAFAVVGAASATTFGPFANSTPSSGICPSQAAAFRTLGPLLDEGAGRVAMDAYKSPFCVFVAAGSKSVDGATLYYRSVAVVSTGQDGQLDAGTSLNAGTHELTLGGDDQGFVFNGLATNLRKLQVTQERMARIGKMYEIHFTSRFLNSSGRSLSTYYFSRDNPAVGAGDVGNPVASTGGTFRPAATILGAIGVGADLAQTAWDNDTYNDIQVGNHSELGGGLTVRSPVTTGAGFLPYTALLRARLPAPNNAANFIYRVVAGGY